ncbi:MAG: nuclear transport factor 2 family protein [Candidatus Angelobacter sp.]
MRICLFNRLVPVLLAAALPALAQEPVTPKSNPRIMTATKQVTMFAGLEIQLLQAVQKKDKAGVQAMLSDELAVEMPNTDRMAGDDWLDSVMAKDYTLKRFGVRQVSVALLGDAAVVKYDRLQEATHKGVADNGEYFVVDVWKKDGDTWKLANRYVSKVSSALPKEAPKPTGKE